MKILSDSKVGFDPISLIVDGKRVFPMMGEMHFSRYPHQYWEEELCKMKAGGIDIVSLYVIWIHHEEIHGDFDFSGDRNLRLFLETVKKCGLYAILRIGPWAHGEARNGGFPDWLLKDSVDNGYEVRTDAPRYLEHVRKFYEKTFEQAKGLLIKDDGPVIGVQIENEYGHCGGKNGEEGEQHMRTLLAMAKEIGFEVPIYTATGWGGAVTGGMIPVMGGYCEAPWDQRTTEIEPSGNYIFTRERNDHNIGSDHGLGDGITFDMNKFPFLTAELGGGLQVTKHRRPIATGLDTAAMTMTKLGSGANLLGYYMYHGGTNPEGKLTTLQETKETGYPNDLPVLSYDFNAPLREYGQMEDTYRQVRLLANFIHDFGSDLCDMIYVEQPGNPLKPDNFEDIRSAVRCKDRILFDGETVKSGYLFVNNYQRRYKMAEHKNVELRAYDTDGKSILAEFEKIDVEDGDFFFYPFNMPVGKKAVITIDATPVCQVADFDGKGHVAYIFYKDSEKEPSLTVKGELDGHKVIVITRDEAVHGSKVVKNGKEHFIISNGDVVTKADGKPELYFEVSENETKHAVFKAFPELLDTPDGFEVLKKDDDSFTVYKSQNSHENRAEAFWSTDECSDKLNVSIKVSNMPSDRNEMFMSIDYEGDTAEMYFDGRMIADSFYTGQKWEVGLKRFCGNECEAFCCDINIQSLKENTKLYLQKWPEMTDGKACRVNDIHLIAQFKIEI
ncbi:Glycosyl hydrolases family 35 [Butyrivibrio proteoclasticus]|uniref:Glycosyl hydrolases family 35 n=1 Tax=Butyrivibrio proteoclasticus TaxID=43305 RepID=A0A1I5RJD5_9FIRM|nr:beta-galactosidase [Butyrivibrio proteoclasticus]SFP58648.1 Glycosyl hydrolases family 35 [Butyrivibrio proteoclasticus]